MNIITADTQDQILNTCETLQGALNSYDFVFRNHRSNVQFYLENKDAVTTTSNLEQAAAFIEESIGIVFTLNEMSDILNLFPLVKIKLAVFDCADTEVRELLYSMVCQFFGGCEAPCPGDNVNVSRILKHVRFQACKLGFKIIINGE